MLLFAICRVRVEPVQSFAERTNEPTDTKTILFHNLQLERISSGRQATRLVRTAHLAHTRQVISIRANVKTRRERPRRMTNALALPCKTTPWRPTQRTGPVFRQRRFCLPPSQRERPKQRQRQPLPIPITHRRVTDAEPRSCKQQFHVPLTPNPERRHLQLLVLSAHQSEWNGKYSPLCHCIGIDNDLDRVPSVK